VNVLKTFAQRNNEKEAFFMFSNVIKGEKYVEAAVFGHVPYLGNYT
jgi:hypothetical protein